MNAKIRSFPSKLGYSLLGFTALCFGVYLASQGPLMKRVKAQTPTPVAEPPQGFSQGAAIEPPVANSIPPDQPVAGQAVPEPTGGTEEKQPVFDTSLDYRYEPVGKRDPFRPFRDSKIGIGQIRANPRAPEPLEKFDVKNLEVVAIVWGNEKPKALIQDPEKQVHSVSKGQRVGKNEGFIAEIREGEVVIVELFDLNGKIVKESFVLPIKK
jgi:type IV pilus assembly protein PilP